MFGGHAPICGGMPNVVRIQLRGAAGLGSALTPRIPNGEGERDIGGPSRVSCNAELDGRACNSAEPSRCGRSAGCAEPATRRNCACACCCARRESRARLWTDGPKPDGRQPAWPTAKWSTWNHERAATAAPDRDAAGRERKATELLAFINVLQSV